MNTLSPTLYFSDITDEYVSSYFIFLIIPLFLPFVIIPVISFSYTFSLIPSKLDDSSSLMVFMDVIFKISFLYIKSSLYTKITDITDININSMSTIFLFFYYHFPIIIIYLSRKKIKNILIYLFDVFSNKFF